MLRRFVTLTRNLCHRNEWRGCVERRKCVLFVAHSDYRRRSLRPDFIFR